MIHIVHRGLGGKYTNYAQDSVKRMRRIRAVDLSNSIPARPGFSIAVCRDGKPVTRDTLCHFLENEHVTIYIGDSKGLPDEIVDGSDAVVSVSSLPVPHQLEAAIIIEQIENIILEAKN